ncbi:hypothetical protein CC1G_01771 [Coprinopsis cinerea okayama7|uniref:F-box domain-containing protein n=1 Tax=Coprinopsis cinerea (strain Okayama-7 / 130 / ATCC MYA-4618 / FGSC 9003) TaxID=240176 RepID=A8N2D2_COPC7|nr:hypothetical protein CC1G_01771 [Coprinopsis cinerea okayama7\|eukprot:XP_001829091.1 hypothetical protein CC1G_01771 [Coprinopsis cinerea okayama7\
MATQSRNKKGRRTSQHPISKGEQAMLPAILRDPEAAKKLFEAILDTPNGKRALSRLARTCRAISEPALNVLWRDLDSIVPLLGLFPNHILKKAKRPGLGFAQIPEDADWEIVCKYSERVRRIAYDETANNVAASVFPILDEQRPYLYILPHLQEIIWKAETPAGLDRCSMFLTPELRTVHLELGANFKQQQVAAFLADMSSRSLLSSFSFSSPTSLPDSFTELLIRQENIEKIVLVAPGALSSGVGRWVSSLPKLKSLQLDLTGRSPIAVEGFFDEIHPRSGCSTPSSICSTDSGIFSGEELDFAELRRSALRLTDYLPSRESFAQLRRVQLTGEVGNIAVFLKHLSSPLAHLDLLIDDPPDNADWQDLCYLISEAFSDSLQTLKISANGATRYADLLRLSSRGEPASNRLSLKHLTDLTSLTRFEIDLPESIVFLPEDLEALAFACPRLEVLRLCPLARFAPNSTGPRITLENLSILTKRCKHLHTIAAVVQAAEGTPAIMESPSFASHSLVRLHVGHSWIGDPLQVAILLSHLAPRLENLRWFQEKNRPGFNEANAKSWQTACDMLPHIQRLRSLERSFARAPPPKYPKTANVGIDATPILVNRGVAATGPRMATMGIQCNPALVSRSVDAVKTSVSASVDATPPTCEMAVEAMPVMVSTEIDATVECESKGIDATPPPADEKTQRILASSVLRQLYLVPSILGFFSFVYKYLITYPMAIPSRVGLQLLTATKYPFAKREPNFSLVSSGTQVNSASPNQTEIPLDTISTVCI